jgi:hypothetical protein
MSFPDRRDKVPLGEQLVIADKRWPVVEGEMMQAPPELPVSTARAAIWRMLSLKRMTAG